MIGETYKIMSVAGIEAVAECLYLASYQPDRNNPLWVFGVALPQDGAEGDGVTLTAHESEIIEAL
jgi:hypothetical protein